MQIGVNNDKSPPNKKNIWWLRQRRCSHATEKLSGVIKLLGIEAYALFRVISALAN